MAQNYTSVPKIITRNINYLIIFKLNDNVSINTIIKNHNIIGLEPDIFKKMYDSLKPSGVLVTYAARGVIKRSMIEVGFKVEKLAGPPGKREMFRAVKI